MTKSKLNQHILYLDPETEQILDEHIRQGGYGGKGFSTAIRNIIREWRLFRSTLLDEARFKITEEGRQALEEASQKTDK